MAIHESDGFLVEAYLNGNEQAISKLVQRHQQRVIGFIYNKVHNIDLANDIFQDTFVKVINTLKLGRYNDEGKFLPWVLRIAYNLTIDHFRNEKKMPKAHVYNKYGEDDFNIFDLISDPTISREDSLIQDQIIADLTSIIEYLPEDQKEVLKMRFYRDMSFRDIADSTGVSINTALGRMRYALINLRKLIAENHLSLTKS